MPLVAKSGAITTWVMAIRSKISQATIVGSAGGRLSRWRPGIAAVGADVDEERTPG